MTARSVPDADGLGMPSLQSEVGQHYLGYWDSGADTVTGFFGMVIHPIDTAVNTWNAVYHYDETIKQLNYHYFELSQSARGRGQICGDGLQTAFPGGMVLQYLSKYKLFAAIAAKTRRITKGLPGIPTRNGGWGDLPEVPTAPARVPDVIPELELRGGKNVTIEWADGDGPAFGPNSFGAAQTPRYILGYGWQGPSYWKMLKQLQAGESLTDVPSLRVAAQLRRDAFPDFVRSRYRGKLSDMPDLRGTYDWHNPAKMIHGGEHQIPHIQMKNLDGKWIRIELCDDALKLDD